MTLRERLAAWRRYNAWADARPPTLSFEVALTSVASLLRQFAPPAPPSALTDADLRASVQGHIRFRRLITRVRNIG